MTLPLLKNNWRRRLFAAPYNVHVTTNAKMNQKKMNQEKMNQEKGPNEYPIRPAVEKTVEILGSAIQHLETELVRLNDSPLQKDSKDRVKLMNLAKKFSSQIPSLEH